MQQHDLPIKDAIIIRQDGTRYLGSDESSGWIWKSARVLASHLLSTLDVRNMRMLELGSGTGWLALTLAQEGAIVTATERPGALPLLTRNVYGHLDRMSEKSNDFVPVEVEQCRWEDGTIVPGGDFDIIIGSDLLYIIESYLPLINTLILHKCKRFVLTWEQRIPEEEASFLVLATASGFTFDPPQQIAINEVTGNVIWYLDMKHEPFDSQ